MSDALAQPITVGDTPGSPNGVIAPTPGTQTVLRADPQREYVAGAGVAWYGNIARALPWAFDDITRDFGDDLYERMGFDAQVSAVLTILKAGILEEGLEFAPAVQDKDADGYARAAQLCDEATRMLSDLETSTDDVLWSMMDALAVGNKVAEQVFSDEATYTGRRQLTLRALKVKPRTSTAFVVDSYWNVLGLTALIPGVAAPIQTGTILALDTPDKVENLLPRAKFAVLSFRPKDNDPRGSSILRPAYNAWWLKMQTWPEYLKYLAQFATPGLIGFTAENAMTEARMDADGTPLGTQPTPEQAMVTTLSAYRNGAALAFPNGASVQVVMSQGEGRAFLNAFTLYDHQIAKAVLTQVLATEEAQHGTRAQGQVHQDALSKIIRQARRAVARMVRRDILRNWVRYHHGDQVAAALTPIPTLGAVESQNVAELWNAVANLARASYLDASQFPAVDQMINLPPRKALPADAEEADDTEPDTTTQPEPATEPDDQEDPDADA